jgi:hypothetical protein
MRYRLVAHGRIDHGGKIVYAVRIEDAVQHRRVEG